ncbi:hypothetical protein DP106_14720 [Halonotius pteroides]|uniref:Site-specific integrase n=1 Tax=Halonotius pteroides TaxID=268735 RepID=A0A3A6Q5X2_9EURY|nr:hypothetical protein DP106_14720 [Halonotius pteroides]
MQAWVRAAKEQSDPAKQITGLLLPFTGLRVDEFCHIHGPTWFSWIDADTTETNDGEPPKLKVPSRGTCHKDGTTTPCDNCEDEGEFTTKFDDGRDIPITQTWNNFNRGGPNDFVTQDLGLRELCKSYFAVTRDDIGNKMIRGDGLTENTINKWCKDIAVDAQIGLERGLTEDARFDEQVPDVFPHDMRGTFIMQLIRNNMQRTKLTKYTGHEHVSSLEPYEERVAEETHAREFLDHI